MTYTTVLYLIHTNSVQTRIFCGFLSFLHKDYDVLNLATFSCSILNWAAPNHLFHLHSCRASLQGFSSTSPLLTISEHTPVIGYKARLQSNEKEILTCWCFHCNQLFHVSFLLFHPSWLLTEADGLETKFGEENHSRGFCTVLF